MSHSLGFPVAFHRSGPVKTATVPRSFVVSLDRGLPAVLAALFRAELLRDRFLPAGLLPRIFGPPFSLPRVPSGHPGFLLLALLHSGWTMGDPRSGIGPGQTHLVT